MTSERKIRKQAAIRNFAVLGLIAFICTIVTLCSWQYLQEHQSFNIAVGIDIFLWILAILGATEAYYRKIKQPEVEKKDKNVLTACIMLAILSVTTMGRLQYVNVSEKTLIPNILPTNPTTSTNTTRINH